MKVKSSNEAVCQSFLDDQTLDVKNPRGTMFVDGEILYSYGYHYPMAAKINNLLLVNSYSYSPTTSRQLSVLKSVIQEYQKYLCVPIVRRNLVIDDHIKNIKFLNGIVQSEIDILENKKRRKVRLLYPYCKAYNDALFYITEFNLQGSLFTIPELNYNLYYSIENKLTT